MRAYYYIEKDGQIFLKEKNSLFTFPESEREIPFKIKVLREMPLNLRGTRILYCSPELKDHPSDWAHKDTIPAMDRVDKIVHLAVNRSLVRHVSDAIIAKDGKVLMVKACRGLIPGVWDIPGGFINYGESPENSLIREVKEETGLDIEIKSLLHVSTTIVAGLYFLALIYVCDVRGGKINPDRTEISEVAWLPLGEAIRKAEMHFVRKSLELFKKTLSRK